MEKSFPFDSYNYDRVYKSQDWVDYYKHFVTDGLCHDNGKVGLNLVSVANFELTLSSGQAFIQGRNYVNTDNFAVLIEKPEDNMYRKDFVVLRCDTRMNERSIKLTVLKGVPSLTEKDALAPSIERSEYVYDLGLYTVLSRPQASSIEQRDVVDVRGDLAYCQLSNPKGFGGASIFRGAIEPEKTYVKKGDIWLDELGE